MGNFLCLGVSKPNNEVLRIAKSDGKILEYRTTLLVKDLLANFVNCGIAVAQHASQHLPPNYELKLGHMYYLLPVAVCVDAGVESSLPEGKSPACGTKRITVVISKQQLQELMSKKMTVEEVLSDLHRSAWDGEDSNTSWRPNLDTIPEGSEFSGR